jgi:dihydrofolate synthase/folylpolyglutamate synthase
VNFEGSLNYLYGLQLFGIKLGLENMQALKGRLPLLQKPLACVHVAGTNGKGSVSAILAEILSQAGYKTGLYTSPHLHCFSERIRINGTPVSKDEIVSLTQEIRDVAKDLPVTFFEATTAMALLAFKKHQVDIAVIETGLGGRLDATNIVDPQLCLITPVSYDHSEYLGEALADIAAEKAGILKQRVPVVVGKQQAEAAGVFLRAAESKNSEIVLAGRDYTWSGDSSGFNVEVGKARFGGLVCRLAGTHQIDNFSQAVAAVVNLRSQGYVISDAAIRSAGESVKWPGRLEWWGPGQSILADTAHNRAGIESLAAYLSEQKLERIHFVTGLSGERSPENVLKPLVKFAASVYAVPVSYNQTVTPAQLCAWAAGRNIPCTAYQTAEKGLCAAIAKADEKSPVVICGSLYLVAELRDKFLMGKLRSGSCRS